MKVFRLILLMLLLANCTGSKQKTTPDSDILSDTKNEQESNFVQDLSEIIHPNLLDIINEFLIKSHSSISSDVDVLMVMFDRKKDGCYISFILNDYYLSNFLDGYLILDEKLISFTFADDKCGNSFVNRDKLLKDIPDKYPSEKCKEAVWSGYDPRGKTFKVNEETMELELVYSGGF